MSHCLSSETAWIHEILLHRTVRAVVLTAIIAICLPTFVYLIFYSRELNPTNYIKEYGTCGYYDIYHLPCGPKVILFHYCCLCMFSINKRTEMKVWYFCISYFIVWHGKHFLIKLDMVLFLLIGLIEVRKHMFYNMSYFTFASNGLLVLACINLP